MEISTELFKPLNKRTPAREEAVRPSLTYWKDAWKRLKKNKVAMICLMAITLIFLAAIIGPYLIPYSYSEQIRGEEDLAPCREHLFGTDGLGRDMLARVLFGMRISLSVGIVASIINLTIGVVYGGISGYFGGKMDNLMMRLVDIIDSIPTTLYVILLMVVFKNPEVNIFELPVLSLFKGLGASLISIYVALGTTYWITMARIVRGEVLSLKEREYVTAAKALGASNMRVLFKHLIPNCIGTIIVITMLQIPTAIFVESFLSFLGLGVDVPMASLGSLAADALGGIRSYFYLLAFPSLAICVIMLTFNLFGDGLRNALDPRMRK
ncbi:MAG: ABC transporter permease [Clostridia bacterium]|nr:ABC transporter permease [Clostridia bacterium]